MRIIRVAGAVIIRNGAILLARRNERSSYPGCWEIPGGKIEPGESTLKAAEREIREELSIGIDAVAEFLTLTSVSRGLQITLTAVLARTSDDPVESSDHSRIDWIPLDGLAPFIDDHPGTICIPDIPVLRVLTAQYSANPLYFTESDS